MAADKRVFSEQEAAEILQRAVSVAEAGSSSYRSGVTKEELERIASEAGIPLEALQAAMREYEAAPSRKPGLSFGVPEERVVDGELDPDDFDQLLEDLRILRNRHQGGVTQVGRSLRATVGNFLPTEVNVVSRSGRTKIVVKPRLGLGLFLGNYMVFVLTMLSSVTASKVGGLPLMGLMVVLGTVAAAVVSGILLRTAPKKSAELADSLAEKTREILASAQPTVATGTATTEALAERLYEQA